MFAVAVALLLQGPGDSGKAGAPAGPAVDQPIVATFYQGPLTLTGLGLGKAPAARSIRFEYGERSQTVAAGSPLVESWTDTEVRLTLPQEVQSGRLTLTADGAESAPVEMLVYRFAELPVPASPGTNKIDLAVAVAPTGWLWVNQEFHLELKGFSPDAPPSYRAVAIPQAEGPGIFAHRTADVRTRISWMGEDITVGRDGRVWFTQGGGYLHPGEELNTSRIISFDPASGAFDCYNVPTDNAQVIGVLLDEARGLIWYAESGRVPDSAISAIPMDNALSNCYFNPDKDARDALCTDGPAATCHWRFPLPRRGPSAAHLALDAEGNIWFTEFWGNAVGRLTPETGEFVEFPFPRAIVQEGGGIYAGSGPWELAFDARGDLWVSEFFDATIARIRPSVAATQNCEQLDEQGVNPCIEEVFVASDGSDRRTIHTVSMGDDGRLWFGLKQDTDEDGAPDTAWSGFIATEHNDAVVVLPRLAGVSAVAGIVEDRGTHDVWFARTIDHKIGRLRQVGAGDLDGDGVPDLQDNCVTTGNPGQVDYDAEGPGDACDVADDDGDGCPNVQELSANPMLGGQRDPDNYWDFYDVPWRTGARDGSVSVFDLFSVLARWGTTDRRGTASVNRWSDPSLPPAPSGYHPAFDRSPPARGDKLWEVRGPDGQIGGVDFFAVLAQMGHECVGYQAP